MEGRGKILYKEDRERLFICIIGEIRHTISGGFEALLKRYMNDKSMIEDILIDMNEATYLDSTNLGLLAQIARYLIKRFNRKPTLVCSNKNILTLLETMGFDQIFTVVNSNNSDQTGMIEIGNVSQDARAKAQMMLDAHRALIELNARNAQVFKNVVELLEKELSDGDAKKE